MDNTERFLESISWNPNNPEIERNFRENCLKYESQLSNSDLLLSQDYQKYINHYHLIKSLYLIRQNNKKTDLIIYDTESEKEEIKTLNALLDWTTCLTQLPNGGLFCFGKFPSLRTSLIIDSNYEVKVLPSGNPCGHSSCIYFKNNVFCFGGVNQGLMRISSKFDLNENRWTNLTLMPRGECLCHSVIFNENILISGVYNKNLLIYSIDIDSFSTIPYNFSISKNKILINIEKLYLIECGEGGLIYESEDEYNWKQISKSIISDNYPYQAYSLYNKGGIYIKISSGKGYYKFDLRERMMIKF